jgi:hypothetical protein
LTALPHEYLDPVERVEQFLERLLSSGGMQVQEERSEEVLTNCFYHIKNRGNDRSGLSDGCKSL